MKITRKGKRGSALIIVLAFLFLLTVVTVAFLSRSLLERQLSNASLNQNKIDLVAQGAVASVIGDLQQEIVAGSTASGGVYYPVTPLSMIPATVGSFTRATPPSVDGLEDLLKVSANGLPFFPTDANHPNGTASNRASAIDTTQASINGRSVSRSRWNKALLLAKNTPGGTDITPVDAFPTPDWIYVARDGSNVTTATTLDPYKFNASVSPTTTGTGVGQNPITERYAYAVYDEGSTLDMNVAGSPVVGTAGGSLTYTYLQPYKNALAYADLSQLPYVSALSLGQQQIFINTLVGWRNYASSQATGTYPGPYSFSAATPPSKLTPFDLSTFGNMSGFLSAQGTATKSDNAFISRQQLIQFLQDPAFLAATNLTLSQAQSLLPYLGTFSRDISQPSYAPPAGRPLVLPKASGGNNAYGADSLVNPSFLNVTVTTPFKRNDGSTAVVGEPVVKKRFALNRLAWVTYEGPSASRNLSDPDMQALINDGIPAAFLQDGTDANIKAYFGLTWDKNNQVWDYNINNGGSGAIQKITALNPAHDPDFFELLKASIGVGSVGKALAYSGSAVPADAGASQIDQPANYNYYPEYSVDFQILQIGANMIDQFQPANYPVQIVFDDGSGTSYTPRTIVGVEDLPYLNVILNGALQVQGPNPWPEFGKNSYGDTPESGSGGNAGYTTAATDVIKQSGVGAWMQLPVIWNPHDPSSYVGAVGPSSFRVLADSAPPDVVVNGGIYYKLIAYAASIGVGNDSRSYDTTATIPGWNGTALGNATSFINPTTTGDGNAEIKFSSPFSSTNELCPEPFVLMRGGGPVTDSNGNKITIGLPKTDFMFSDPNLPSSQVVTGLGLKSYIANQPNLQSGESMASDTTSTTYAGFYLGAFPLAWNVAGHAPVSAAQSGAVLAHVAAGAVINSSCYMTYRMQYQAANGSWVTYDTKYGYATSGSPSGDPCSVGVCPSNPANTGPSRVPGASPATGALMGESIHGGPDWGFVTDPRTSRFGIMNEAGFANPRTTGSNNIGCPFPGPETYWASDSSGHNGAGWLDVANETLYTIRPDGQAGFFCITGWPFVAGRTSQTGPTSGWMAFLESDGDPAVPGLAPGMLSQNNADSLYFPHQFYGDSQGADTGTPNYFADPDGMVRRAMGAYVPLGSPTSPGAFGDTPAADTTVGLPIARNFGWATSLFTAPVVTSPNRSITPSTTGGPPKSLSQSQSRPYFLHRPFNSVAELGYVFSDTPWRNLDFFTAESGDSALLDTFCINDTTDPGGLVAGKVNLNTRQTTVLQAIIAGGYLDPVLQASGVTAPTVRIDSPTAKLVAQALVTRTTDTGNISNGTGPLGNVSELVGKFQQKMAIHNLSTLMTGKAASPPTLSAPFYDGKLSYAGFSGGVWDTGKQKPYVNGVEDFSSSSGTPKGTAAEDVYSAYYNSPTFTTNTNRNGSQETATYIQRFREAPIRALSAAGTTRVWNLMIDVIAQAGRFPSTAASLSNFNVEGERRYWVHVALDRLTGKVLDEQVEEVKE